ncbi:hypothetical protein [Catellatospora sichuanensis]|uniref:hypothetical protein n=1 Tax=Catellatospora sichuanensis TaxID=1969805 RepID=UPI001183E68C|nr:hypothetical protein [Catellatospora sichuanensis]
MTVFACACCGATLTVPVARVPLPAHADAHVNPHSGHELLGVLMEPGTYAVRPYAYGPPFHPWAEVGEVEAAARGVYAPVYSVPYGPAGAVAVASGDVRGTVFIPDRLVGCLGLNGGAGPNVACAQCGTAVATYVDDCECWQAVWLDPRVVRSVPGEPATDPPLGWETLRRCRPGTPPVQPDGRWDSRWEAAAAVALAQLLAASGGAPVIVPDGPVADAFRGALDVLLPPGPAARALALAGPGLPAVSADIALVPQHPQTGEHWPQVGAVTAVPLAWDTWAFLAFHRDRDRRIVQGGGSLRDEIHRDYPPAPLPTARTFHLDRSLFLFTLARLPEVRLPWLRAIYDRLNLRNGPAPF